MRNIPSLEPLNKLRFLPFDCLNVVLFITDVLDVLTVLTVTADRRSEIAFQREDLSNESKCNCALPFVRGSRCFYYTCSDLSAFLSGYKKLCDFTDAV